jgi:quinol monooxygenase YgiN
MDSLATSYQITRDHIDSFTYLIIERYSDQQYYEIMIDIEASRHSIIDYDQYLA